MTILERYDLEIDKIISTISKNKSKFVLLQFPDALKPYAAQIAEEIELKTKNQCKCLIWLGSCFGSCDLPEIDSIKNIDLIIQFGHSPWNYKNKNIKILK